MGLSAECEQCEITGLFESHDDRQGDVVSMVIYILDDGESTIAMLVNPTSQYVDLRIIATVDFHGDEVRW
jgi:hypothetical protein